MTAPEYARLASRLLVLGTASLPPPPPKAEARARAIDAVAAAIALRASRRRALRWAFASVGAAAVVANAAGIWHFSTRHTPSATSESHPPPAVEILAHPVGGGASVVVAGSHAPLVEGRALDEGSRVLTPPDGRATLAFSTGTTVVVGENTDVTVAGDRADQVLHLSAGWIDLHVAKLRAEQQFFVDTAELQVEVRGTKFRVSIVRPQAACAEGARTRIAVTEGIVVVHRNGLETRLGAGENWPRRCETDSAASSAETARMPPSQRAVGPSAQVSRLGEQNDLFAGALAAKRQGDVREALTAFERLIKKYPASPLAENASVESMRLLKTADPARAIDAALRYLATYPAGYARSEAEAILAGGP